MEYMAAALPAYATAIQPLLHAGLQSRTSPLSSGYLAQSPASMYTNQQHHFQYNPALSAELSPIYRLAGPPAQACPPYPPLVQHSHAFPFQVAYNVPRQQAYPLHEQPHYADWFRGHYDSAGFSTSSQGCLGQDFSTSDSGATLTSSVGTNMRSNIPRGPPRKPRQSGHALWVGNLPVGARIIDLKDHFSRGATNDIESLKLISKSNCAFVNYRSQAACAAAVTRFRYSRFHGMRLVCRLTRTTPSINGVLSGVGGIPPPMQNAQVSEFSDTSTTNDSPVAQDQPQDRNNITRDTQRFFVLKSLTLQDLELSSRNGIWATQAHNEDALNSAYEVCHPYI